MMIDEFRVCENCHHENNVSALECEQCGYDLSFIIPTKAECIELGQQSSETLNQKWKIEAKEDNNVFIIIESECLIGRESSCISQYLSKSNFISRQHAKLIIRDQQLYVIDGSTNGTYINGNRIEKIKEVPLKCSDELRFGDISFIVKR